LRFFDVEVPHGNFLEFQCEHVLIYREYKFDTVYVWKAHCSNFMLLHFNDAWL